MRGLKESRWRFEARYFERYWKGTGVEEAYGLGLSEGIAWAWNNKVEEPRTDGTANRASVTTITSFHQPKER